MTTPQPWYVSWVRTVHRTQRHISDVIIPFIEQSNYSKSPSPASCTASLKSFHPSTTILWLAATVLTSAIHVKYIYFNLFNICSITEYLYYSIQFIISYQRLSFFSPPSPGSQSSGLLCLPHFGLPLSLPCCHLSPLTPLPSPMPTKTWNFSIVLSQMAECIHTHVSHFLGGLSLHLNHLIP